METFNTGIEAIKRTAREFALLFLDLDRFEQVNDRFGHFIGSQALCQLADVLCICSRKIDTRARYGGDEFPACPAQTGRVPANWVKLPSSHSKSLANDGRGPKLSGQRRCCYLS